MTYEERANLIGQWLKDELLPRYRMPEHMDDDTARREVADMVTDLTAAMPAVPLSRFLALLVDVAAEVRRTQASRTWPTIAALCKAVERASRERPQASGSAEEEPPHVYEMVRDWWRRFGDAGPGSCPKVHHAERLVSERVATWGQLFRKGFPIPHTRIDEAKAEKDQNHDTILRNVMALAETLRGNGVSNPAFRRAAE